MRGIIRGVDDHHCELLASAWEFCASPRTAALAAALGNPRRVAARACPTTAAAAFASSAQWSLDGAARRFDAEDWWFRCRSPPASQDGDSLVLGFDGLASCREAWLNGERC
jgi:beta-mannosidase